LNDLTLDSPFVRRCRRRDLEDAYRLRRHCAGGKPVARENTRVKWLWSAKPQAVAISASGVCDDVSSSRAR
jgi:hypothetical protein